MQFFSRDADEASRRRTFLLIASRREVHLLVQPYDWRAGRVRGEVDNQSIDGRFYLSENQSGKFLDWSLRDGVPPVTTTGADEGAQTSVL